MRNKTTLLAIRDTAKLQQWLYADENHAVEIRNAIETPLRLTMDEDGNLFAQNLNFPDIKPSPYGPLTFTDWLEIIEQLKKQPPVMKTAEPTSRWDEILIELAFSVATP